MLTAASAVTGMILPAGMASGQAASPASLPAQGGNAGYYRFRVGDISATVLSDGLLGGPPRIYASNAPEAELQDVLRRAFLPTDRLTLNLNTLLIETNGKRVLLEAGAGQTMGPQGGRLFENLAAIGLRPEDIDVVVISHTHPDHVGNLRTAEGGKAFPRAAVFAPRADWDFFVRNDPDLSYMPCPRISAAISQRLSSGALNPSPTGLSCTKPARRSSLADHASSIRPHPRHGELPCSIRERSAPADGRSRLPPDRQCRPALVARARSRQGHRTRIPPPHLRQGGGRPAPRPRLPLSVPGPWPNAQDGRRLCLGSRRLAVLIQ